MRARAVVLDFGAQYAQLICRRIREAGVYAEIWPSDAPHAEWDGPDVKALVLSGGPGSVYEPGAPGCDPEALRGRPVLGICYGMQWLAKTFGGRVEPATAGEYGRAEVEVLRPAALFSGVEHRFTAWMSHGDQVLAPPPGFRVLARTADTQVAAMGDEGRRWYGVQFHPEVAHTPVGERIIRNFLYDIAGLRPEWTPAAFLDEAVRKVREAVGGGRALGALSGGVDSMVATAIVARAIGDRLTCIFVDHGLLRLGEAEEVRRTAREVLGREPVVVEAEDRFLAALAGVTDPEEKRRRIGGLFAEVFEEALAVHPAEFLVQGTLYPDVVESGRGKADVIKTHHNVGGLPPSMRLRLVEPLRDLFKDEVRRLGRELGLPETVLRRQPFPGPGLAVRIVGEVTRERLHTLRLADAIVREEVEREAARGGIDPARLWQYFAVLTGARSVGVKGDHRAYGEAVAVRVVESRDAMTADWLALPEGLLRRLGERLTRELPGITRVVYDVTSKPPGTIEWE